MDAIDGYRAKLLRAKKAVQEARMMLGKMDEAELIGSFECGYEQSALDRCVQILTEAERRQIG